MALCSDSLSEGVNLQAASALVHLDMPSVIRVAEQRTGRVDRLDSPHAEVEVWWPRDAEAFALSADARFLDRVGAVTELLGTNLPLPEDLQQQSRESVDADTLIREYERTARSIEEAEPHDAFAAVRGLVEGSGALVEPDIYEYYRERSVRVLSRVSVVASDTVWAGRQCGPGAALVFLLGPGCRGNDFVGQGGRGAARATGAGSAQR